MNLTVGRVNLGDTNVSWDIAESSLAVRGSTDLLGPAGAQILRDQLMGYVDNSDEEFVPVVSADEPSISGFYRVSGASVSGAGVDAHQGRTSWAVNLDRVASYKSPLIEVVSASGKRANTFSWTDPSAVWRWLPRSCEIRSVDALHLFKTRPGGQLAVQVGTFPSVPSPGRVLYTVSPENYYEDAALIQIAGVTATGRPSLRTSDTVRLTNGVIECEILAGTNGFRVRKPGGTWVSYVFAYWEDTPTVTPVARSSVVVLRNAPEQVAVRIYYRGIPGMGLDGGAAYAAATIDIGLRRGEGVLTCRSSQLSGQYPVGRALISPMASTSGAVTGTPVTQTHGGVVHAYMTPDSGAIVRANGAFDHNTPSPRFGIGINETGYSALDSYKWAMTDRQRLVVP